MKNKEDEIIDSILSQLHPEIPKMISFKIIKENLGEITIDIQNKIIDEITYFDKLIERPNKNRNEYTLTDDGVDVVNKKGFSNYKEILESELKFKKDKEILEFEKSKIDFELAKRMLKEYPNTKLFARIGLVIGVLLLLKELYILIYK